MRVSGCVPWRTPYIQTETQREGQQQLKSEHQQRTHPREQMGPSGWFNLARIVFRHILQNVRWTEQYLLKGGDKSNRIQGDGVHILCMLHTYNPTSV